MYRIRAAAAADYEAIAGIATLIRTEPITAEEIAEATDRAAGEPNSFFRRFVAEDEQGQILGYGFAERMPWMPDGRWDLQAATHPQHRNQGIGSAIYATVEKLALEHGATGFQAWLRGDDDASFAWAQHRGFENDLLRTEAVLDLTTFDPARFADAVRRVRESGLRLELLEGPGPEYMIRGMYEIEKATAPDVPDWEPEINFPSYEEHKRSWLAVKAPTVIAMAFDGDKAVGNSTLILPRIPGKAAYTGFTGVLREYRGRSVALACKVLTMEYALRLGVTRARTNNDFENPSMLAVNAKMGYQLVPGPRRINKRL